MNVIRTAILELNIKSAIGNLLQSLKLLSARSEGILTVPNMVDRTIIITDLTEAAVVASIRSKDEQKSAPVRGVSFTASASAISQNDVMNIQKQGQGTGHSAPGARTPHLPNPFNYYMDNDWSSDADNSNGDNAPASTNRSGMKATSQSSNPVTVKTISTDADFATRISQCTIGTSGTSSLRRDNSTERASIDLAILVHRKRSSRDVNGGKPRRWSSSPKRRWSCRHAVENISTRPDTGNPSSSFLPSLIHKFTHGASIKLAATATRKSGVLDVQSGVRDALFSVRSILQSYFSGVVTGDSKNELRMLVLIRAEEKPTMLGVIIIASRQDDTTSRIWIRKSASESSRITNEEFDCFCSALYGYLIEVSQVVRPHYN